MAQATSELVATVEELARERGLTLEEACEGTRPGPNEPRRRWVTLRRLESGGFAGFGALLDRVLHFTPEEKKRVADAWTRSDFR